MKTLLSWSGGKDSALALDALRRGGEHDVAGLVTTLSEEHQRVSMHGVRIELVHEQARQLALPLTCVEMPAYRNFASDDGQACPIDLPGNNTYESAMLAAFERAREDGVEAIAFGDIFLEDLRDYRERLLARAGLKGIYPLWQRDTRDLLHQFIDGGWRAIVVCTDGERLPPSWSGREIDAEFAAELPAAVDPCGERGEYHSFVYDGPLFSSPISFEKGTVVERAPFTFFELLGSDPVLHISA
jgi:uncharacterized protein (TIGR00290 family)